MNPASILDSTKKVLGMADDYTAFDLDVIMAINGTFGPLSQLGVGPAAGFEITDNTTLWSEYTGNLLYLGMVKTFIWKTVQLAFDPPTSGFAISAIQKQLDELAWRINVAAESAQASGPAFWDVTGLSDFPSGAVTGDWGLDFNDGNAYSDNSEVTVPGMWDLTGLSDFPVDSVIGDIGIDLSTGDVYKRTS